MKGRSLLQHARRIGAAAFYLGLGAYIVWLAVSRWNGLPADPSGFSPTGSISSLPIDPAIDRTDELVAALGAIPFAPAMVLPKPPPGMKWETSHRSTVVDVGDVVNGSWTPEIRSNLQAAIAYLQTPAMEAALNRLSSIKPGAYRSGSVNSSSYFQVARLLVARSRLRQAGSGDVDGAIDDLVVLLHLSSTANESRGTWDILIARAYRSLAFVEFRRLSHEQWLTKGQVSRIINELRELRVDQHDLWRRYGAALCDAFDHLLNCAYSDDGHGNGWLVLSRMDDIAEQKWSREPRCGAWNLLSIFFSNRRTVAFKIVRLRRAIDSVGALPFWEGRAAAEAIGSMPLAFDLLDGPLTRATSGWLSFAFDGVFFQTAEAHAALACAALSAYRTEHGSYPATLDLLKGDYLDAPAIDPFDGAPLRYRQKDGGSGYLLYSVGPNCKDEGGVTVKRDLTSPQTKQEGDVELGYVRPEPNWEPKLVRIKP